jgi:hypothetical protein
MRLYIRFVRAGTVLMHARFPVCERESWPRLVTAGVFLSSEWVSRLRYSHANHRSPP